MSQRKSLIWFLIISFGISWTLFLIPLVFRSDLVAYARTARTFWAAAMWGPGLAAILVTLLVEKQPFRTLRLNKLGKARYYLIAWLLPPAMVVLTLGLSGAVGTAKLDLTFRTLRMMALQSPSAAAMPLAALVAIQIAQGLLLGPIFNILFGLGEELGWRGFLLPHLLPLGQWRAIGISGVIWGLWHAPVILQGYNFPQHPVLGVLLMTVATVLLGAIFSWLYLATLSPWAPALAHGSLNAMAGLPLLFLAAGFDTATGGFVLSVTGWVVMAAVIGILVLTKQLPVRMPEAQPAAIAAGE